MKKLYKAVDHNTITALIGAARKKHEEVQRSVMSGFLVDGDTILGDTLVNQDVSELTGAFLEVVRIYEASSDKDGICELFELLTGTTLPVYLQEVMSNCKVLDRSEISFANPGDWFIFDDPTTVEWVYYNPVANGGGRFVVNHFTAEQFADAETGMLSAFGPEDGTNPDEWYRTFFCVLSDIVHCAHDDKFYDKGTGGYEHYASVIKSCDAAGITADAFDKISKFFKWSKRKEK